MKSKRDADGDVYALPDEELSLDDEVRPGLGALSLPTDHWTVDGIRAHDYLTSSPAFQAFHTRSEGDRLMLDHLLLVAKQDPIPPPPSRSPREVARFAKAHRKWSSRVATAYAFYGICRAASCIFWENPETRWK